jgi:hypothetical protein
MPKKQYPSFYEKAIPVALAVIAVLVLILLAVVVFVLAGS